MFYYLLQIIVFQTIFLIVYDVLLRRETFFNYNRGYLLITSLISLVIPFIKLPQLKSITQNNIVIRLPEVLLGKNETKIAAEHLDVTTSIEIATTQNNNSYWSILFYIGIGITCSILLYRILKLYWLTCTNPKRWKGNILLVNLINSTAAFSFFNTIFMGEDISETQQKIIFEHELVHVNQKHSLDLLYFEILKIAFWYNPVIYIYQNRIKEVHEFIADTKAMKHQGKTNYYKSLLQQILDVNKMSFTNSFFKKSLIKKRIVMLQKSDSKPIKALKYFTLIPLIIAMLVYTSLEVKAQNKESLNETELVNLYLNEIKKKVENGDDVIKIFEYAGIGKHDLSYISSKEEYLKSKAFFIYMAERIETKKGESFSKKDKELIESMKVNRFKSYKEYVSWMKSDEAKSKWENSSKNGQLRLVVKDMANKTSAEKEKYDKLLKKLELEEYDTLLITDGSSFMKIDDYENTKVETVEVPFSVIDEIPTTELCSKEINQKLRKQCLFNYIAKHTATNFNMDVSKGLEPGKKRVFVSFKINTKGYLTKIKTRGPSIAVEEEAKRVLKLLPKFIPGKHKGELVTVAYSLPIVFEVK